MLRLDRASGLVAIVDGASVRSAFLGSAPVLALAAKKHRSSPGSHGGV